jgi:hypothetical protein
VPAGFVPVLGVAAAPELSELLEALSAGLVDVDAELLLSLLPDSVVVFFGVLL